MGASWTIVGSHLATRVSGVSDVTKIYMSQSINSSEDEKLPSAREYAFTLFVVVCQKLQTRRADSEAIHMSKVQTCRYYSSRQEHAEAIASNQLGANCN